MKVVAVEFLYPVPLPEPLFLQLQGVRSPLPMMRQSQGWSITLDLAEGVYSYQFRIADLVTVNDARRSTQRVVNQELWSVVEVTAEGPVWVERSLPTLAGTHICQGINETGMPLMVLDQIRVTDLPVVLWTQVVHLYQNALLHVFLLNPDHETVFGGEFVLEYDRASPTYELKFWLSLNLDPQVLEAGPWSLLIRVEGGPIVYREVELLVVEGDGVAYHIAT